MNGHTPGLWRYDLHRDDDGTTLDLATVDIDAGPDGRPTDYGTSLLEGGYLVRESDAENDANARLIAAAPDLLAMCQRFEAECRQQTLRVELEGFAPDGPVMRHWRELRSAVAAVIARATGETEHGAELAVEEGFTR
jgi:hypothetical protein